MAKKLTELLALLPEATIYGDTEQSIAALSYDSRKVEPGSLFVCLVGARVDGHDYIEQAKQAGAVAILVEKDVESRADLVIIKVANTRVAMQVVAPWFWEYPSRKLRLIGITGTNGKTTTTYLLGAILKQAGFKVGIIGTIQTLIGDRSLPVHNTTPDVIDLQEILAQMVSSGMEYVVMEVSSHALALGRVAGCEFDIGVFTNMTRDHLDFHLTFENYLAAKCRLFQMISASGAHKSRKAAIINGDDPAAVSIIEAVNCKTIIYGMKQAAELTARQVDIQATGAKLTIAGAFGTMQLALKITGLFNVYNVLAATGAALAEGIGTNVIREALENFQSVPGRFELVDAGQAFAVIVDYAHTPDGLENILKTARQIAKQRIIVVFGCGGDRDRTKRPIMGKLAVEYADVVIATSDNPRSEDPEAILSEIEAGIRPSLTSQKTYRKISDRREAIRAALQMAERDDVVIVAGKGHENYQILKDKTIVFDDKEVVCDIIREMR
ncbi:MAG TPA: UDP-N-acetylmuramoyl-L-alanyl-D-glutamate--2,6-diaminopimelate ligase [Negativicutes bacterium]